MATADLIAPPPAAPRRDPAPRSWSPAEFRRMCDLGILDPAAVELIDGTVFHRAADDAPLRPVLFNQEEFCRLWSANLFRNQRVQLIGGEILEESPMLPAHATGVRKATRVLERVFATGYEVRPQLPLDLTPLSRPHPDVAVVVGAMEDYAERHPKTAVLVVEVSESTFEEDTHAKASLYAAAGIADYWVIDTTGRVLVFRDPRPAGNEPFGHIYATVSAHGRDDTISTLAAPAARVAVGELLP